MPSFGKKRDTGCPVAFGLDTFGDRWSLLIIRDMMFKGKKNYSDFLEGDEKIATNILADRLKYLEKDGIIRKSHDPENRRKCLYKLTNKGVELAPIMLEMVRWSGKYDPNTIASEEMLQRIGNERAEFEAEIYAHLKDDQEDPA